MKPGDIFLNRVIEDFDTYGQCFVQVTDTPDYYLAERIPVNLIIGGFYYG